LKAIRLWIGSQRREASNKFDREAESVGFELNVVGNIAGRDSIKNEVMPGNKNSTGSTQVKASADMTASPYVKVVN